VAARTSRLRVGSISTSKATAAAKTVLHSLSMLATAITILSRSKLALRRNMVPTARCLSGP
jgi:hypothetical protein